MPVQRVLALIPAGIERDYVDKASGHYGIPLAKSGERMVSLA